jgi:nitrogen PTS system EIIA component
MKVIDYLNPEWIIPSLQGTDKRSVLKELSQVVAKPCEVGSVDEVLQILLERERLGSTGIGEGIAIPHGRLKKLKDFCVSFGRSVQGVEFDSIDGNPSHLFFLVLAPENSAVENLKLLGRIVTLLKDPTFKRRLIEAPTREDLYRVLSEEDEKY